MYTHSWLLNNSVFFGADFRSWNLCVILMLTTISSSFTSSDPINTVLWGCVCIYFKDPPVRDPHILKLGYLTQLYVSCLSYILSFLFVNDKLCNFGRKNIWWDVHRTGTIRIGADAVLLLKQKSPHGKARLRDWKLHRLQGSACTQKRDFSNI